MTAAATSTLYTPEDLLQLDGLFELVDGQLLEKQRGFLAGRCVSKVASLLANYLQKDPAGDLSTAGTFQCFPNDPSLVRRPDIAFIAAERAVSVPDEGHLQIAPDIATEIISPGDRINDFEDKLADYRSAELSWSGK